MYFLRKIVFFQKISYLFLKSSHHKNQELKFLSHPELFQG